MTIEATTDDGHISSGKDSETTTTKRQQRQQRQQQQNNYNDTTTTNNQTKQRHAAATEHADHDVNGDDYNNYKNYSDNTTTFIYEHLRHTELLRPVHPFAGNGTASQPLPALRNLVRRAAAVYSGHESFIVYIRNETAPGH